MRSRRTVLVFCSSVALVGSSLALMSVPRPEAVPAPASSWRVTVLQNGKSVCSYLHEQPPTKFEQIVNETSNSGTVSYLVEPVSAPGISPSNFERRIAARDRSMVEFLLLLPPATLLVCLIRNVIGLNSFGTFAPALLGLSFREVESVIGVFVVLSVISCGWWLRRGLNALHLLQVPRTALLLSCVVIILLALIVVLGGPGPRVITLFPLVILTGMIERFWSMDEEDGAISSLGVLASTLSISGCVWLMATVSAVPAWMMRHPETLGLIMAGRLLLGRYTGYRLLELWRFRTVVSCQLFPARRDQLSVVKREIAAGNLQKKPTSDNWQLT
jgi:7 transmembrane helices usually fused to an inactive transglutaminase